MFFQRMVERGTDGFDGPQDPVTATIGSAVIGAVGSNKAAKTAAKSADASAQAQLDMYYQSRDDFAPWRGVGENALYEMSALYGLGGQPQQPASQPATLSNAFANQSTPDLQSQWNLMMEDTTPTAAENFIGQQIIPALSQQPQQSPIAAEPVPGIPHEQSQQNAMARFFQSPDYQFRLQEGQDALERSAAARGMLNSGATGKALVNYAGNMASGEFGNYANRLASLAGIGQSAVGSTASLGAGAAANAGNAMMQAGQARASGYMGVGNTLNNALSNYQAYQGLTGGGVGFSPMMNTNFTPTYKNTF